MQISSENYISVLTEQVKALTIENMQLKALIMDAEDKKQDVNKDKSNKKQD